jgi:hypothetical protein
MGNIDKTNQKISKHERITTEKRFPQCCCNSRIIEVGGKPCKPPEIFTDRKCLNNK